MKVLVEFHKVINLLMLMRACIADTVSADFPSFLWNIVTKKDFKILEDFHNQLDEGCQWMAKVWIDLLEPLVI